MLIGRKYNSPFGEMVLGANSHGLVYCLWAGTRLLIDFERMHGGTMWPGSIAYDYELKKDGTYIKEVNAITDLAVQQLDEYFAGKREEFDIPLIFTCSEWNLDVYLCTSQVPYGELDTYGNIADCVGRPKAAQAVGNVLAKNPFHVIIPCHRVTPKNKLGNYAGGEYLKAALIHHEMKKEHSDND